MLDYRIPDYSGPHRGSHLADDVLDDEEDDGSDDAHHEEEEGDGHVSRVDGVRPERKFLLLVELGLVRLVGAAPPPVPPLDVQLADVPVLPQLQNRPGDVVSDWRTCWWETKFDLQYDQAEITT